MWLRSSAHRAETSDVITRPKSGDTANHRKSLLHSSSASANLVPMRADTQMQTSIGDFWLIGVRADEITVSGSPHFVNELMFRFRGRDLKREGSRHSIRCQSDPNEVRALQRQHGKEFDRFYYIDIALAKAAELSKIRLNRLKLIAGDPPGAQIATEICLPPEFANG